MKVFTRGISVLLAVLLVFGALPSAAATAGVIGMDSYRSPTFAVREGNWYLLTVTTAADLADVTDDTLLYVDARQATADDAANGYISFDGFYLRRARQAYYHITGVDDAGQPVALRERSEPGNGFSGGQVLSVFGGVAKVTPVDRFGYYHTDDAVLTDAAGAFSMDNLAAGYYVLRVDQPGYKPMFYPGTVPFVPPSGDYFTLSGGNIILLTGPIDLSANLGDVNRDGQIGPADIAVLAARIASGVNLSDPWFDLNRSGAADAEDLELLLVPGKIPSTRGALSQNPVLTAITTGPVDGVYALNLDLAQEMQAAGLVLDYDCAVLALCTPDGTAIDPAAELPSAVTAGADMVLYDAVWAASGTRATVGLRLRGGAVPTAEPEPALATLTFRLRDGKTEEHLWDNSIRIQSAYAAIGSTALVRRDAGSENTLNLQLTYPNSTIPYMESLTLGGQTTIAVPPRYTALNQPTAHTSPAQVNLNLTALGAGGVPMGAPAEAEWSMTGAGEGITLSDGTLTIAPGAEACTVEITARYRSVTSNPLTVEVTREPPIPTRMSVTVGGLPAGSAETVGAIAGEERTVSFAAEAVDQYGEGLGGTVNWSLTGTLPAGVAFSGGVLTLGAEAEEGGFILTVVSEAEPGLVTDIAVTVLRQELAALTIRGETTVAVPDAYMLNSETPLTAVSSIVLTATATDTLDRPMPVPASATWQMVTPRAGVTLSGSAGDEKAGLTVAPGAPSAVATVELIAGLVSDSMNITIQRAAPVPTVLQIFKGDTKSSAADSITATTQYSAKVLDQYGTQMASPAVTWSGTPPAGVSLNSSNGTVTFTATATAGSFSLTATSGEATQSVSLTITPPPGGGTPGGGTPGGGTPGGGGIVLPPVGDVAVPYHPAIEPSVTVNPPATATAEGGYQTTMTAQEAFLMLAGRRGAGPMVVKPQVGQDAAAVTLTLLPEVLTALQGAGNADPLRLTTPFGSVQLPPALLGGSGALAVTLAQGEQGSYTVTLTRGGAPVSGGADGAVALVSLAPFAGATVIVTDAEGNEQVAAKSAFVGNTLVVPLIAGGSFRIERRTQSFVDLAQNRHWAEDSVDFAVARGLVNGVEDGSRFAPEMPMTRGMLMTVLHRLEGLPTPGGGTAGFSDVPAGSWYAGAVAWAGEMDILSAADGRTRPEADITREEIADMLYRYAAALGADTAPRNLLDAFPDAVQAGAETRAALRWAVAVGLINGKSDGRLDPAGGATRAEVVTLLERFVVFLAGEQMGGRMK